MKKDIFSCPICQEQFNSPIRSLPYCGHDMCEGCLENLMLNSSSLVCPNCRKAFPRQEVTAFARNRGLEEALQELQLNESSNKEFVQEQREEDAISSMMKKDYQGANIQWKAMLVNESDECNKLIINLNIASCGFLLNEAELAFEKCSKTLTVLESLTKESDGRQNDMDISDTKRKKIDEAMQKLVDNILGMEMFERVSDEQTGGKKIIKKFHQIAALLPGQKGSKKVNIALEFIKQRSDFIKMFFDEGDRKSSLLADCGRQMEDLFKKVARLNKQEYFKRKPWINNMEDILDHLQSIEEINIETKSKYVASFYYSFAICSYKIGDIDKAKESCAQAVAILKTVFASKAGTCRALSYCYFCLGNIERKNRKFVKAKNLYEQAEKYAGEATDWNLHRSSEKSNFVDKISKKMSQITFSAKT